MNKQVYAMSLNNDIPTKKHVVLVNLVYYNKFRFNFVGKIS